MIISDIDAFIASGNFPPKRIISLVPSLTELLVDIGLEDALVGVTKFCVHPVGINKRVQVIGGTKNLRVDLIRSLNPDLIIANKEENEQNQVEALASDVPVYLSEITCVADAYEMMRIVGRLTQTTTTVQQRIFELERAEAGLRQQSSISPPKKVLYLIWRDPWMSAGGDTFIDDMLNCCGWENVLAERRRYPSISDTEIRALEPELVLLSSEPYPFKDKHRAEIEALLPNAKVQLADGEAFSWYGTRMHHSFDYLRNLVAKMA